MIQYPGQQPPREHFRQALLTGFEGIERERRARETFATFAVYGAIGIVLWALAGVAWGPQEWRAAWVALPAVAYTVALSWLAWRVDRLRGRL